MIRNFLISYSIELIVCEIWMILKIRKGVLPKSSFWNVTRFTLFTPFLRKKFSFKNIKWRTDGKVYVFGSMFTLTFSCNYVRNTLSKYWKNHLWTLCMLMGNNVTSMYTNMHTHWSIITFQADVDRQNILHDIRDKFIVLIRNFCYWFPYISQQ